MADTMPCSECGFQMSEYERVRVVTDSDAAPVFEESGDQIANPMEVVECYHFERCGHVLAVEDVSVLMSLVSYHSRYDDREEELIEVAMRAVADEVRRFEVVEEEMTEEVNGGD